TGAPALLLVDLIALVAGGGAVARIAHGHPPAALATQYETLQEGVALADRTPAVIPADGAVVVEALLVAEELLPTDIAGVSVMPHDGPVGESHAPGPAFDPRCLLGQRPRAGLGAAVDIGARVAGIVQDIQNATVPERLPEQFPVVGFTP